MSQNELTHIDSKGRARMVDVGDKAVTKRRALAGAKVLMAKSTLELIVSGGLPKGDVLAVSRIAGIMAAKKTSDIIPMCHPLEITSVEVELLPDTENSLVRVEAVVKTSGRTGVEMEALTAASAAALTIYDMCKAVDREIIITDVMLLEKSGGKSGSFKRTDNEKERPAL